MPEVRDQLGNVHQFREKPRRVISLVPSLTELLVDLGLEKELAGITKFCVHPDYLKEQKAIIGGTKNVHSVKVRDLKPDFVLASKEENTRRTVAELPEDVPVYVSDIANLKDLKKVVSDLGIIFGVVQKANDLNREIDALEKSLQVRVVANQSCLYLIWKDPFMAAGTDTFINEMLKLTGCENALKKWGDKGERYPAITVEQMTELNPDHIFLSSEPFPFTEKHAEELSDKVPSKIRVVDGEAFSWYGTGVLRQRGYLEAFAQEVSDPHR